jgi:hypothetical protein
MLLTTVFVCGCNYQTQVLVETQEQGEIELRENPANVETNNDLVLVMLISNNKGEPARVTKSEATIVYKLGTETIGSVEIRDGRITSKGEQIPQEKFRNNEVLGRGIKVFVPFPLTSDSAFVTMRIKSGGKWQERTVIVTKLEINPEGEQPEGELEGEPVEGEPEPLTVTILADGSSNGILVIPTGTTVTLSSHVSGGRPPYNYRWLSPTNEVVGTLESIVINNFSCGEAGRYTIEVTDANGNKAVI